MTLNRVTFAPRRRGRYAVHMDGIPYAEKGKLLVVKSGQVEPTRRRLENLGRARLPDRLVIVTRKLQNVVRAERGLYGWWSWSCPQCNTYHLGNDDRPQHIQRCDECQTQIYLEVPRIAKVPPLPFVYADLYQGTWEWQCPYCGHQEERQNRPDVCTCSFCVRDYKVVE